MAPGDEPGDPPPSFTPSTKLLVCALLTGLLLVMTALRGGEPPQPSTAQSFAPSPRPGPGSTAPALPLGAGAAPVRPVRLRVPVIGVNAPMTELTLDETGALRPPPADMPAFAGWYGDGTTPGSVGTAVTTGHVDTPQGPGSSTDSGHWPRVTPSRSPGRTGEQQSSRSTPWSSTPRRPFRTRRSTAVPPARTARDHLGGEYAEERATRECRGLRDADRSDVTTLRRPVRQAPPRAADALLRCAPVRAPDLTHLPVDVEPSAGPAGTTERAWRRPTVPGDLWWPPAKAQVGGTAPYAFSPRGGGAARWLLTARGHEKAPHQRFSRR